MFRTAAIRASRPLFVAAAGARASAPIVVQPILRTIVRPVPTKSTGFAAVRCYSAPASLSKPEVEGRIIDLLTKFDKVAAGQTKVNGTSHFANDLGLDSLDTVEVVMAIEEEFSIEIPDKNADAIHSVENAVSYILAQPDAH